MANLDINALLESFGQEIAKSTSRAIIAEANASALMRELEVAREANEQQQEELRELRKQLQLEAEAPDFG